MKLFLVLAFATFPICCLSEVSNGYIGCFKDESTRAMPVKLSVGTNLIKGCEEQAAFSGYKVYGVQNQGECWSGPNAHNTYYKYGTSSSCRNGKGGPWTNSVYRVLSDGASLAAELDKLISNATSIEDVDVGAFVAASSKLLNFSTSEWKKNPKMADNFLSASEGLLSLAMNATSPVSATSKLMVFSVDQVDTSYKTSLRFPDYMNPVFSQLPSSNSFVVPTINNSDSANIGGYVYSSLHERLPTTLEEADSKFRSHWSQHIVSKVLSCQVNPPIRFGLNTNETVTITLGHNKPIPGDASPFCGFWKLAESNKSFGVWSTQGCTVMSWNTTQTQCNCTHLTNFAILMQYKDVELDDNHGRALNILTNIGCSLSLAAIFVTVAVYFAFGLYRAPNFHIHINLCFAIAMAQVSFLSASQAKDNERTCVVMSAFLHYFCLCVFTWMLVEGLQVYKKVVSIFSASLKLVYCHLIGWGSPVLIVLVTYLARKNNYTDLQTCWLSPDYGIRWAFIGPVLAVIMVNVIVTIITLYKRLQLKSVATKEITFKLRTSLRALVVLLPIFGITWLFGIFGFTSDAIAAMYIFVILNASQGLLMFVFHCALNAEVRKAVFQGRRMRIQTRNGTVSSGSNKVPLQKIPSKYSESSNRGGSRQSSGRSARSTLAVNESEEKERQMTGDLATSPKNGHLVP